MQGSHRILDSRETHALVTVPLHAGKTLAPKTLKSIIDGARLSIDEFRKLL